MLTVLQQLPEHILEKKAHELHQLLSGPTLIHLAGKIHQPVFVSVLLHGNETTGWEALRGYLKAQQGSTLARSMSIFIGNVFAAVHHQRVLDKQLDYNRVWQDHDSAEGKMMAEVVRQMRQREVFASIDIHNNTGKNPHYACINKQENEFFQLAHLFSRTVVYFIKPDSVQSMAFSKLCPAVTVECGLPEHKHGVEHARNYIEKVMQLKDFNKPPLHDEDFELYHTMATVKIPSQYEFGFMPVNGIDCRLYDICFEDNIDRFNFTALEPGQLLARIKEDRSIRLEAVDEQGNDVSERYFDYRNGEIRTKIPLMPSMLTMNKSIVRQDCLCYMMEKIHFPGS